MRVAELQAEGTRALAGELGHRESVLLLRHVLGATDAWLIAHADAVVVADDCARFRALVGRRVRGEPIAYLTGTRGFFNLDLEVTPDVLIPRPETELLVESALQRIPVDRACRVADLGTGAGAIALALGQARPLAHIMATDTSAGALALAQRNAARNHVSNVAFAQGDWAAALGNARFELIVSNPPYIAAGDLHLRQGDLRFEPHVALASGADGLDAIRTIVGDARAHLLPGGWLLFEHGWEQGAAVRALLAAAGYAEVFTARDLEARERVSGARIP